MLHVVFVFSGSRVTSLENRYVTFCRSYGNSSPPPPPPSPSDVGRQDNSLSSFKKWRIVLFLNYFALSVIALENLPHSLNKSLTKPLQLCQGLFRALGCWLVCLCVYQLLVIFSVIMIGRRNLYAVGLLNQNDNDSPGNRPSLLH